MKRFLPTKIRARRAGFTMLEMMLAVMLLGLVLSTVYTIWSASLTAWKRGSDAMDKFQRQRVVIDAINELASSAVLFQNEQGLYTVIGQKGAQNGADSISFVTASDVLLPAAEAPLAGLRRVTISLQRDESGYPYLAIQNSPALTPTEAAASPTMCRKEARTFRSSWEWECRAPAAKRFMARPTAAISIIGRLFTASGCWILPRAS